jgi:hypothetical protein
MVVLGVVNHSFRGLFLPIDVGVVVLLELSDAVTSLSMQILSPHVDVLLEARRSHVLGMLTVLNEFHQIVGCLVAS